MAFFSFLLQFASVVSLSSPPSTLLFCVLPLPGASFPLSCGLTFDPAPFSPARVQAPPTPLHVGLLSLSLSLLYKQRNLNLGSTQKNLLFLSLGHLT